MFLYLSIDSHPLEHNVLGIGDLKSDDLEKKIRQVHSLLLVQEPAIGFIKSLYRHKD